ncbi:hypothetical protein [Chitinophaga flava]|uniref:Uncharacterized protein n=1 Tax=Chitinophaga flava TaxID=2259036 RepID=A0A365XQW1_9BACT|nr:hypothetical protein [Chitinophaga flava]RBL88520.1 hypothetical protein DF182_18245 [Chitinophaga flava]
MKLKRKYLLIICLCWQCSVYAQSTVYTNRLAVKDSVQLKNDWIRHLITGDLQQIPPHSLAGDSAMKRYVNNVAGKPTIGATSRLWNLITPDQQDGTMKLAALPSPQPVNPDTLLDKLFIHPQYFKLMSMQSNNIDTITGTITSSDGIVSPFVLKEIKDRFTAYGKPPFDLDCWFYAKNPGLSAFVELKNAYPDEETGTCVSAIRTIKYGESTHILVRGLNTHMQLTKSYQDMATRFDTLTANMQLENRSATLAMRVNNETLLPGETRIFRHCITTNKGNNGILLKLEVFTLRYTRDGRAGFANLPAPLVTVTVNRNGQQFFKGPVQGSAKFVADTGWKDAGIILED